MAVDGKALRGTRHGSDTGRARHVLTAITARTMALLAQAEVDGKSNEITVFCPLLRPLDLTDAVITVDALHTQREHATFLVEEKNAHYILVVKNQPSLYRQLKGLLWRQVSIAHREDHHGHDRSECRQLKVLASPPGWPSRTPPKPSPSSESPGPATRRRTYREDASLIRTGNGPAVMAALRTIAIGILKLHGWTNIAKANRHNAHQAQRCLTTLGIT
ncbi:ISAs1 family transposase [Nonomuraea sp. NPDC050540]|uniref:ISAs1 family transposase n=1 Tax=Nonomuraea sp. NPDC050540 TaxID=3364367 RepID=UPI0037920DB8